MFYGQSMPRSEASQGGLTLGQMFRNVGLLGALVVCFLLALFSHDALGIPQTLAWAVAGALLIAVGVLTRFSTGALLLFILFVAQMLVGSVELGTDGWIQNISGNILTPAQGKILFVFTSCIMFALRFSADFIQKRTGLSPIGILFTCFVRVDRCELGQGSCHDPTVPADQHKHFCRAGIFRCHAMDLDVFPSLSGETIRRVMHLA